MKNIFLKFSQNQQSSPCPLPVGGGVIAGALPPAPRVAAATPLRIAQGFNPGQASTQRGVSVGVVMVVIIGLGMIVDSVMTLTLRTHNTQQDAYIWMDAKNAAEAATEYGFAQLTARLSQNAGFPTNSLAPGQAPLSLPAKYFTTFGNSAGGWRYSKIILPDQATYNSELNNPTKWATHSTDLVGGVVPPGQWKYIDPNQPGNEFDPLKGKRVFTRNVQIYGKATATDFRNLRSQTVYAMEEMQIRDAPLFANAIFYNMDLEISPGAAMTVSGPVHGNYNGYFDSGAGLSFNGQVTMAGKVYHGVASGFGKTPGNAGVSFANASGTQVSMYQSGSWLDSTNPNFRQKASQLWGGNLESVEFGVPKENPIAIKDYVRDNPSTSTTDDALNYAYQLIQPPLKNTNANYNAEIEKQKFAYKAGLTIVVNTAGGNSTPPTVTLQTYQRDASNNIVYDGSGNPLTTSIPYTGSYNFVTTEGYSVTGSGNSSVVNGGLYDGRRVSGVALVKVNMGKLSSALGDTAAKWNGVDPKNFWNGIVYVQFSGAAARATDQVQVPVDGYGVALTNGSTIPNPAFAIAKGIYGTTVATNNPVYIQGNYNADGSMSTGTNGAADNSNEPPAAIAGDAITVLSNNWNNSYSRRDLSYRDSSVFTEVSAAFLTGVVPSDKANNNDYSGGVENFPRFLEDWSGGNVFRYRGSMVAMFESEVANEPWGTSSVYNPPNRDWSFAQNFGTGNYPPGTPNSRSFRRVSYRELTKAQFEAATAAIRAQMGF